MRVFGRDTEHVVDRPREAEVQAQLGAYEPEGIGRAMLGYFDNGRLEAYLEGRALTDDEMRSPDISANIASQLAVMTNRRPTGVPSSASVSSARLRASAAPSGEVTRGAAGEAAGDALASRRRAREG